MHTINVGFLIPDDILKGLSDKSLVGYGGVIRNAENGQIYSHLKEIVTAQNSLNFGGFAAINAGLQILSTTLIMWKLNKIDKRISEMNRKINTKLDTIIEILEQNKRNAYYQAEIRYELEKYNQCTEFCETQVANIIQLIQETPPTYFLKNTDKLEAQLYLFIQTAQLHLKAQVKLDKSKITNILNFYTSKATDIHNRFIDFKEEWLSNNTVSFPSANDIEIYNLINNSNKSIFLCTESLKMYLQLSSKILMLSEGNHG